MRGSRAKKIRRKCSEWEKNPPEGFIDMLESRCGDITYERAEFTLYRSAVTIKKMGKRLASIFGYKETDIPSGYQQRNLYRLVKRLWKRGELPQRYVEEISNI